MSVHVNSVDLEARNTVRSRVTNGTLIYVAKVRVLAAFQVSTEWSELDVGYLALSAAGSERAFLTLFDPNDFSVIMIHEIYYKFDKNYSRMSPLLYTFPSDICMIGLQFLLETEAKEMEKQIIKATPAKGFGTGLRRMFGTRSKAKADMTVSMPQETEKEAGMAWDPETGYEVSGSLEGLSAEHKQFVLDQGCTSDKP
jgi:hypothetical protein